MVHSIIVDTCRNQIAPEMKKDLTNINNELAHCETQLSAIRIVSSIISMEPQSVTADLGGSEEPSLQVIPCREPSDVPTSSEPLLVEYKELIACLERSNTELSAVNEQLTTQVTDLESEKASLIEELQRLQDLRGEGTVSAAGEDIQMQDGVGETMKRSKDVTEEVTIEDNKRVEESDEETEEEQEPEVTSIQQLEESTTDKEQVQSNANNYSDVM